MLITANGDNVDALAPALPAVIYFKVQPTIKVLLPFKFYRLVKANVKAGEIVEI